MGVLQALERLAVLFVVSGDPPIIKEWYKMSAEVKIFTGAGHMQTTKSFGTIASTPTNGRMKNGGYSEYMVLTLTFLALVVAV